MRNEGIVAGKINMQTKKSQKQAASVLYIHCQYAFVLHKSTTLRPVLITFQFDKITVLSLIM